jgi:hypothetical protein
METCEHCGIRHLEMFWIQSTCRKCGKPRCYYYGSPSIGIDDGLCWGCSARQGEANGE